MHSFLEDLGIISTSDQSHCADDFACNRDIFFFFFSLNQAKEKNTAAFYKGKCLPKEIIEGPNCSTLSKETVQSSPENTVGNNSVSAGELAR